MIRRGRGPSEPYRCRVVGKDRLVPFPWRQLRDFRNTKKRLVRSPKIYLRDSGILHALLRLRSRDELFGHPAIGPSRETYALEQILNRLPDWSASFYRSSGGAEIDLVLERGTRTVAVEFKATSSPRETKGFYLAAREINGDERYIVAPLEQPDLIPYGDGALLCALGACHTAVRVHYGRYGNQY